MRQSSPLYTDPIYNTGYVDDSVPGANAIAQKQTFVDNSGILREVEPVVTVASPNLTSEVIYQQLAPVYVPPPPQYNEPEPEVAYTDSEAYQQYMQEVAKIAALQNPNITVIPNDIPIFTGSTTAPSVVNETPQQQFMGMEEFIAISDEGIVIPAEANLTVIPINEIKEPELFQVVVEAKIAEPEKPVYEIIMQEVVKPLSEVPRNADVPIEESADEVKNIILFQNKIVEVKTENPGLTITEATLIAAETSQPSTVAVEEVVKKVDEIVTMQEENGISNTVDQQAKAKAKLDKKLDKIELGLLDQIVEYIYKTIYANG